MKRIKGSIRYSLLVALFFAAAGTGFSSGMEDLIFSAGTGNDPDSQVSVPAEPAGISKTAAQDPIEIAEQACLNSPDGASTMGMLMCLAQSYKNWDAKLNVVYGGLMKQLAPEAAASLRAAQKAWLAYRDANEGFMTELYDPAQMGSLGRVELMETNVKVLRERVLTIQNHLGLYVGGSGTAIDDVVYPVDAALSACQDQDPSTAGLIGCAMQASGKWDAEMNMVYGMLKRNLNPKAAASLRTAQTAWLVFRDAEQKAIGGIYGGLEGTMYRPMAAYSAMSLVRQRTLILKGYLASH